MPGKLNVIRYEAHTGVTATFSAATFGGAGVKVTGDKQVGPAANGDVVVGTAVQDVEAGEKAAFRVKGDVTPMIADGAVAAGALVVAAATAGRVQARAAETAEQVVGVAYTAAGAAGNEFLVIVL